MRMLQVVGKVLDVSTETVNANGNSFESITVSVMTGKADIEKVRIGRDYPTMRMPREGDEWAANVVVSAFSRKDGAGFRVTAISEVAAASGLHAVNED